MEALIAAGMLCLLIGSAVSVIALAMRRYRRVKASFNIGSSGFYIEADDANERIGPR